MAKPLKVSSDKISQLSTAGGGASAVREAYYQIIHQWGEI